MATTHPNHPTGIRKYIDDQIDAVAVEAGLVTSVAGRQGVVTLTKTDVGLANVDNTADSAKPVSTLQAAADTAATAAAVSQAGTAAAAVYARVEGHRGDSPAAGVIAALNRSFATVVQLVGDSTGDQSTEWFGLLGAKLGTDFSNYNVLYRPWNLSTQFYDIPTVMQSGPSGQSALTFASGAVNYTGDNLTANDLDVRLRLKPTSWASGGLQVPMCKWASTGNQMSWWFGYTSTGLLCLTWTTSGAAGTQVQKFSTVVNGFTAGTEHWIRATLDVDNGASGSDLKFYTSVDGITWTQLGTTVTTAGVTSIFGGTARYQLGALDTTLGSTYAGDISWAEVRDGIDGRSVVPPLPMVWDQISNWLANTVVHTGSPTIMMLNGSEGGQNMAYWDNATRRPKVMAPHGQHLILLSTGHNETQVTSQTYVTAYSTWITNIKALIPNVPIVILTQNPQTAPRVTTSIRVHAARGIVAMALARSLAGVYGIDTFPAFTDTANQVSGDGVHPTTAGEQVWRDYVYNALFK